MSKLVTLRIGICSCSADIFRGKLKGDYIKIGRKKFFFEEIVISEKDHNTDIESEECHFFLDSHQGDWFVEMVYINDCRITSVFNEWYSDYYECNRPRNKRSKPTPKKLRKIIKDLILSQTSEQRKDWLSRMT